MTVTVEKLGAVATVTLDRPETKNAITLLWGGLHYPEFS